MESLGYKLFNNKCFGNKNCSKQVKFLVFRVLFFAQYFIQVFIQDLFFTALFFISLLFTESLFCNGASNGMCYDKSPEQQWTWSYKKIFSDLECSKNSNLSEIAFFKENVKNFSQLIFSWNSRRPKMGGFSFYVKTRNARTKKWSGWHKMFDWGRGFQKSYCSTNESSQYAHVRLEAGLRSLADAFKIIIKSYGGADLGLIKSVCACTSDFNKFKYEAINNKLLNLKSVYIKNVPKISQRLVNHPKSAFICSPTSCSMIASYFNKYPVNVVNFVENVFDPGLGDGGSYGSWPFNVVELYRKCNGKELFYVQRMNGFIDLYEKLCSGCPVVVSVRGKMDGGQKEYNNGHLIVVVGWDSDTRKVICHDPAFYTDKSTFVKYNLETFLRGWEGSNRLAYVANFKNNLTSRKA